MARPPLLLGAGASWLVQRGSAGAIGAPASSRSRQPPPTSTFAGSVVIGVISFGGRQPAHLLKFKPAPFAPEPRTGTVVQCGYRRRARGSPHESIVRARAMKGLDRCSGFAIIALAWLLAQASRDTHEDPKTLLKRQLDTEPRLSAPALRRRLGLANSHAL